MKNYKIYFKALNDALSQYKLPLEIICVGGFVLEKYNILYASLKIFKTKFYKTCIILQFLKEISII